MSDLCLQSRLPHACLAYRLKSSSLSLFRWAEVAASFCERVNRHDRLRRGR